MQAVVQKFTKFISGEITLVIPVYQRNYDWKVSNCERLLNDIGNIVKYGNDHFIGTFVYQSKPADDIFQDYIIIDGQQRIASIILFARALSEFVDDDFKANISAKFIKHTASGYNFFRLRPTEFDQSVFQKIMDGTDDFTADEKSSALYRNYQFFREKLSSSELDLQKLFNAIYKLNVVSICLDNENPQEIFESLNSTGLDLSQADLIRNFLLMPLDYDKQTTLYKNYWLKIENLLRPSGNVEKFLVQYLIARRKSDSISEGNKKLSGTNFYETFKIFFAKNYADGNTKKVEDCLGEIFRYAKFFKRCIFNYETKFANLSALDKKFYELTFLRKADNAPIILMYLLDRYEKNHFDEATFIEFVDALISLAFRAKVCKCNGIDQQFAGNVLARLDKENPLTVKAFWQAITFGSGDRTFPNDKNFLADLAGIELQDRIKTEGFKYLLYSLERAAGTQNLPAYSEVAVEQILPKKPNPAWKNYLSERGDSQAYELWLQALGNQTLVNAAEKGRNDIFDKKKIRYAQSCFSCTKTLSGYSHWTSKQIQARAKNLAAAALKIWTLPEEFNATIQSAPEIFNLDSDFNAFTSTHPATFSISNTAQEISTWRELLREVVRKFYALDSDNFRRATQLENVPKKLFSSEPRNFKIDDNFYMKIDFDTKTCLRATKILVENFDRLGGTNFKDEIWFTLRQETT